MAEPVDSKKIIDALNSRMAEARSIAAMAGSSGVLMEVTRLGLCVLYYEAASHRIAEVTMHRKLEDTAFLVPAAADCLGRHINDGVDYAVIKLHIDPAVVRFSIMSEEFYLTENIVMGKGGYWVGESSRANESADVAVRQQRKKNHCPVVAAEAGANSQAPNKSQYVEMTVLNLAEPRPVSADDVLKLNMAATKIRQLIDSVAKK